ncbi:thioredoxin [Methylobacterium terrae]|uniref:Thioredoxin n=1 Tax=Methylobacterium terrae TaxID=2202827 RepID=A0A2U8WMJ5_9HYPH|nr:thioredoxin [Methylobacterium terrae]AWN46798.1 thioredoxin [Methylobacterium terrae]
MAIEAVTDDTFEQVVLRSAEPVVVEIWAPWCGPCRLIAPALEEAATEFQGRVRFVKLNIDENEGMPRTYGVQAMPTLLLFKNGNLVSNRVGAFPKTRMVSWIKDHV